MDTLKRPQWEELAGGRALPRTAPGPAPAVQAAHLTHELRAPITSIRLGLEVLAEQIEGRLESRERQMLSLAIRNTTRLEGLVNDIMDYTKISAGRLEMHPQPCDARELVDDAVDAMQALATAKGVKIVKEYAPLMPRCAAESRRIVQVLVNLVSNAVKFTPSRGLVTVVICEGKYEHAGTLLFKVKDTGCGIAQDDLEAVFRMFEQAGSAQHRALGTGLGLTLARAFVELHGGRIWAESWKGSGATFCFTIPIASIDSPRPVAVYPKPLQLHGLLAEFGRRFNAFLAMFV